MKLEIKKSSLIFATTLFVFSGIFNLAKAATEEDNIAFNKIVITNNTPYDTQLQFKRMEPNLKPITAKPGQTTINHQAHYLRNHLGTDFEGHAQIVHESTFYLEITSADPSKQFDVDDSSMPEGLIFKQDYTGFDVNFFKANVVVSEHEKKIGQFQVSIDLDRKAKALNIILDDIK